MYNIIRRYNGGELVFNLGCQHGLKLRDSSSSRRGEDSIKEV